MAIDKGMTAKLEDRIAEILTALTYHGSAVFKLAQPWQHQLESFTESFARYSPFALIGYSPAAPQREGDYDLCQNLRFEIIFGLESSVAGIAYRGDDNHLGGSKIRDLIIAALEDVHPGPNFDCDRFHMVDEVEYVDAPKKYAAGLFFETKWLPVTDVEPGTILLWYGSVASIPAGWLLCDGSNATPDLRDKFIIGAGDAYSPGDTGGVANHLHAYTANPHTHTWTGGESISYGDLEYGTIDPATVTGTTNATSTIPPYHSLNYIIFEG